MSANAKKSKPTKVAIKSTLKFYTFSYLINCAEGFWKDARDIKRREGSNHVRVAAVMYAAFAFEAYLNHLGQIKIEGWNQNENRKSFMERLREVAAAAGLKLNLSKNPFQYVIALNEFRDKIVHGKTLTEERKDWVDAEAARDACFMEPKWLAKYHDDRNVAAALKHTLDAIKELHAAAGLDVADLALMAESESETL